MTADPLAFRSRRSPVFATRGMIASSQPLATEAGLEILRAGGNAADAAIAVAAALGVTEPTSTGLGGDCFALYYEGGRGSISCLNGSGRAPAGLTLDLVRSRGFAKGLPPFHPLTITAPGACAGWCDLLERHGTRSLPDVLAPAIRLAEDGFPVAPLTAASWQRAAARLLSQTPGGRELLLDGRGPQAGEIMRNPGLARTLRIVAKGGAEAFYQGEIAKGIASAVHSAGGVLGEEDLASHRSTWDDPIHTVFEGIRLFECPPNGQGLVALLALNLLSRLELPPEPLGADRLHLLIEALRLAFADGGRWIADPRVASVPVDGLLSVAYAKERATGIDPAKAASKMTHGTPPSGPDTVYFSVADGQGNACSFTNSNYMGFGTGIVPTGTGFSLQNRGLGFSLDPDHPNSLAPGKRPYHTIIPALATRETDGSLYASFGVMGGFMQPQGHVQVLLALVRDGLDPQAALDRPRICLEEGRPDGDVLLEDGISAATADELRRRGHPIRAVQGEERVIFGRGQVILRDPDSGVLSAGSDPRADGLALGL